MNSDAEQVATYLPLAVYCGAVLLLLAGMIVVSWLLGGRHQGKDTALPYESGVEPTGNARLRFDIKFYLVAMLFVIFDLEVVFIFAWAVAARELGWVGYSGLLVFIAILVVGLVYEWRMGALDFIIKDPRFYRLKRKR